MKKLICLCLVLCLLLMSSCGSVSDPEDYADRWEEQTDTQIFDYEACSQAYTEMIAAYPEQGEGAYASCRLIFSTDDPLLYQSVEAEGYVCFPDNTYMLQFASVEDAMAAEQMLYATGQVNYVEPDVIVTEQDFYSWGAMDMGVDLFATGMTAYQKMSPVIAVVDGGVNDHEMIGSMQTGWDFVENDGDPRDTRGHGTHVAGIVSDLMGDFSYSILPLRVLNGEGKGYAGQTALAIRYAADHGAHVINLSLGGEHSNCKEEAIQYAIGKGCSVVAAAGNDSQDVCDTCPAHIPGVVTVSSVRPDYTLAITSNFGYGVDVCAPGVGILSACHTGGYVEMSGTSMAAPHISGILALILASGAAETAYEAECILFENCIDLGDPGRDFLYGWGYPDMSRISAAVEEKNKPEDYWILGINSPSGYAVGKMEFSADGTYTVTDYATEAVSTGTYYGLGEQQLTVWEDTPTYFMGEDFFVNTGYNYETISSYAQPDGSSGTYTLTYFSGEHPYPDTAEPEATLPQPEPAPSGGPMEGIMDLADGTYYVDFYLDSIRSNGVDAALTVDFMGTVELSDSEVYALSPGTYYGNGFSLNVEYVSFSSVNGVDYVDINDWEYGEYIPSRGVWQFKTVNDQPLTYYMATGDILIPSNAVVWDYLTPFMFGQNAIGMQEGGFMDSNDSFYCTASIADFREWHNVMSPYMVSEKAYVTVQDNAVTVMTIPAHP